MFLPNCENMLPVRKCLSVEIDTSPLVILFFSSVLSRASWTNYFSQERFANICK